MHNSCSIPEGQAPGLPDDRHVKAMLETVALQNAIFNSVKFSSIATDVRGVIQIFNVGAECMLGYAAEEVVGKVTPADFSDPQELTGRARALSLELGLSIAPGFEALVFKASRGLEDIYELTYLRKDGSRLPAVVSVTALRGTDQVIIGYLLIGTDNTARKRASGALIKAAALQNAIFNSANFSSIATDAKGVIQIFNVGAERMLGFAAVEVVNRITPADLSDPQELLARARSLSQELDTCIAPGFEALVFKASRGIEDVYDLTYIRKDGSRFPAVVSITALRDAQNAIIGYLLIAMDNTAHHQAAQALLEAGALQNAIFNSANFSSIATDARGVIQIFNVGAERMLGYQASEVKNLITPADLSDPTELVQRARALSQELGTSISPGFEALVFKASRGIEDIYDLTYIRKDGSRFPAVVSVTALRDAQGELIGYLLIGTDNTARKRIEAEQDKLAQRLRDQQFYTRSLFEANVDALSTTDPDGIITDVNKQMEALTGCTRDELIGAPFKGYFTDPARAEAGIKRVLAEKTVANYELVAAARDGRKTVVSYNATTFHDRNRQLQGVFAGARDVTEHKLAELERSQLQAQLQQAQKMDSLGSLAGGVAHDMNNVLGAILGLASANLALQPIDSPAYRAFETITHAAVRGGRVVKSLLRFAHKDPTEEQNLDLNALLREEAHLLERTTLAKVRLVLDLAPDLRFINGNGSTLTHAFMNLCVNAVDAMPDSGTLTLRTRNLPDGWIEVMFEDNGCGMTEEIRDRAMDPFFTTKEVGKGTGLGLSLVYNTVMSHHGKLEIQSEPGCGTRIRLCFPVCACASGVAMLPGEVLPLKKSKSLRVLLVDDDELIQRSVQLLLEVLGHRVTAAFSGEAALLMLEDGLVPDVVLLDMNMPGLGGCGTLPRLRGLCPAVPVVLATGRVDQTALDLVEVHPLVTLLPKPFSMAELDQCLGAIRDQVARAGEGR
jgi:PAS domain S-box-containing protein